MLPIGRRILLALVLLMGGSVPARADLTIFAGLQGSPVIRPTTGISLGFGVLRLASAVVGRARGTGASMPSGPDTATGARRSPRNALARGDG